MAAPQNNTYTFKRVETKYLLSRWQYELFRAETYEHLKEDSYGLSTICNIYYDTDDFELIRTSIEQPEYKEKLRVRSYGIPSGGEHPVFIEIKKKLDGIVYKRRISLTYAEARNYLIHGIAPARDSQILREIDYFLKFHQPKPSIYIAYDRIAAYDREDPGVRVTFDTGIRSRDHDLKLSLGDRDTAPLLPDGDVLMEIKAAGAYPLWLTEVLSRLEIYPCTFSKYGYIYKQSLREAGNPAADLAMKNLISFPERINRRSKCLQVY